MKKLNILYRLIVVLFLLPLTGCDNILDVELDDEIRSTEAITDEVSLNSAVTGLYESMQSGTYYGGEFVVAQALTGGIADATGFRERFAQLDNAMVPASSLYLESAWADAYQLVNSSNLILEKLVELNIDNPQAEGTALFFRALGLFDALRQFGIFTDTSSPYGVPVFTSYIDAETAATLGRNTVAETYDQILSDLQASESLLDYDFNKFYVSKGVVEALLARVYLYQGNYPMAEEYAELVLSNPDYELNTYYEVIYEEEGSMEAIFELQFLDNDGNNLTGLLSTAPPEVSASYEDFYQAMDNDGDDRAIKYYDSGSVVYVDKYGISPSDQASNSIIIRLSEIYLILSEAQGRQGNLTDAVNTLNIVRERSLPGGGFDPATITDFDGFTDVLLEERARELAFEGHRWFDIVRLGKAEEIRNIPAFRTVYPIPLKEITVSNGALEQNPGY